MNEELVVLSLFDGVSCGQIALTELGYTNITYYASEIEKMPIKCTQHNFQNTIQLGDVRNVDVSKLKTIKLLLGGSPCTDFSFSGKRQGMQTKDKIEIFNLQKYLELKNEGFEFEGQSYLFWEYIRILTDIRKYNPDVKFLLENVEMGKKWERVLSEAIGVFAVHINSALVSAQNRKRIYFTNIKTRKEGLFGDLYSDIPQPKDEGILLKDILESEVDEKYYLSEKALDYLKRDSTGNYSDRLAFMNYYDKDKSTCVTANHSKGIPYKMVTVNHSDMDLIVHNLMPRSSTKGKGGTGPLSKSDGKSYALMSQDKNAIEFENKSRIRRLTPTEVQKLQTIPQWYDMSILSDTAIYRAVGNGWTIKVIMHILQYLKK